MIIRRLVLISKTRDADWRVVQTDYNECQLNSRLCQHVCINTLAGYRCQCKLGYQLHADQRTCTPKRPQFSGRLYIHGVYWI